MAAAAAIAGARPAAAAVRRRAAGRRGPAPGECAVPLRGGSAGADSLSRLRRWMAKCADAISP